MQMNPMRQPWRQSRRTPGGGGGLGAVRAPGGEAHRGGAEDEAQRAINDESKGQWGDTSNGPDGGRDSLTQPASRPQARARRRTQASDPPTPLPRSTRGATAAAAPAATTATPLATPVPTCGAGAARCGRTQPAVRCRGKQKRMEGESGREAAH
jgi:hypothetical protein